MNNINTQANTSNTCDRLCAQAFHPLGSPPQVHQNVESHAYINDDDVIIIITLLIKCSQSSN